MKPAKVMIVDDSLLLREALLERTRLLKTDTAP